MSRVVHAPDWRRTGYALESAREPSSDAFCNHKNGATPKKCTVTCQTCIKLLRKKAPQWMNILLSRGWKFSVRAAKPRKGRKADPRQSDFADLFTEAK